jgi:hypothetical protein
MIVMIIIMMMNDSRFASRQFDSEHRGDSDCDSDVSRHSDAFENDMTPSCILTDTA